MAETKLSVVWLGQMRPSICSDKYVRVLAEMNLSVTLLLWFGQLSSEIHADSPLVPVCDNLRRLILFYGDFGFNIVWRGIVVLSDLSPDESSAGRGLAFGAVDDKVVVRTTRVYDIATRVEQ